MTEQTKSLIRHLLTALGTLLVVFGLGKYTGAIDYLLGNLDSVWQAIIVIGGAITTVVGFFKDKVRFEIKRS